MYAQKSHLLTYPLVFWVDDSQIPQPLHHSPPFVAFELQVVTLVMVLVFTLP